MRAKTITEKNVETCPRCLLLHGLMLVWREQPVENKDVWDSARDIVEALTHEGLHLN